MIGTCGSAVAQMLDAGNPLDHAASRLAPPTIPRRTFAHLRAAHGAREIRSQDLMRRRKIGRGNPMARLDLDDLLASLSAEHELERLPALVLEHIRYERLGRRVGICDRSMLKHFDDFQ